MNKRQITTQTFWLRGLMVLLTVVGLCVGSVSMPGVSSVAFAQSNITGMEEAQRRFEENTRRLEVLRQQRLSEEGTYKNLTDQIAARKRGRDNEELVRDLRLQGLLTQARGLAEGLNALQKKIRAQERSLESARRDILQAYELRLSQLEDIVLDPSLATARADAIVEINKLRQSRHAYVAPRPASPDLVLEALPSADKLYNDPEEALAAAAELDDTDRRLKGRIDALEEEISVLESAKRLRRKASAFRERQTFFDDDRVGGRRVARSNPGESSAPTTDRGTGGSAANEGVNTPNGADRGSADDANNVTGGGDNNVGDDFAEESPPQGAPDPGLDGDPGVPADPGAGRDDDGMAPEAEVDPGGDADNDSFANDGGGELGTASELPGFDQPGDVFGGTDIVVGNNDVEGLGSLAEENGGPEESLEAKLRRMRREKAQLKRKSQELQQRAQDLKRLADDTDKNGRWLRPSR